tara:strand:+ start:280 stop:519 length:240 start_codon:yes stop_codon:yes gene_type:complete
MMYVVSGIGKSDNTRRRKVHRKRGKDFLSLIGEVDVEALDDLELEEYLEDEIMGTLKEPPNSKKKAKDVLNKFKDQLEE